MNTKLDGPGLIRISKRFWEKVKKTKGCWNWSAAKTGSGYGAVRIEGKQYRAHRASWLLFKGPIPAGKLVCHSCDNRLCVRPSHLFIGTTKDNMDDKIAKGRDASGEKNGRSKLTHEDVLEIRASDESNVALGKRYAVCHTTIRNARLQNTWKELVCHCNYLQTQDLDEG